MNKARQRNKWIAAMIIGVMVISLPCSLLACDRGFNQPGAAGNQVRRDPGINQPGAAGNVGGPGVDPGFNQPGAAGNVGGPGVDPGLNQPGAAGNVGGAGVDPA